MTKRPVRIGDLQLRILRVLWDSTEPAGQTVGDVQAALSGEPLAYTTVATMLRKMETRGFVHHEEDGRRFLYRAAVARDEVRQSMANDLVDRLFSGSLSSAVSHLLDARDVSREELDRLEQLIADHRKRA